MLLTDFIIINVHSVDVVVMMLLWQFSDAWTTLCDWLKDTECRLQYHAVCTSHDHDHTASDQLQVCYHHCVVYNVVLPDSFIMSAVSQHTHISILLTVFTC